MSLPAGPVIIELTGYSTIFIALVLGKLSHAFFPEFLIFGYLFAAMISVGAVLREEVTYRRYSDWKDVARLIVHCILEQIPYRQLQLYGRLQGTWPYFRGDVSSEPMKRAGFQTTDSRSGKIWFTEQAPRKKSSGCARTKVSRMSSLE